MISLKPKHVVVKRRQ